MTRLKTNLNFCLGLGTLLLLAGCASEPKEFEYKNLTEEVGAIKADGGIYKVGNPYTVMGQSYTPREDYGYVETGMASWYGDDFHNKRTANGETYDMRAVTAAHRTLPLPSIVRVTNLENGRSIIARVNDQETIKNLVAGGMGISIISEKAAHNFLQEKRLLVFELPQAFSERSLYLIYRKNYLLPSYVKEFLGFISQSKL